MVLWVSVHSAEGERQKNYMALVVFKILPSTSEHPELDALSEWRNEFPRRRHTSADECYPISTPGPEKALCQ